MTEDTAGWAGHVIVCGLGGVGLSVAEQLHRTGVRVVVLDDDGDSRRGQAVAALGIPRVPHGPQVATSLAAAGLAGATAVVCVLDDDLGTLEAALLARELRPDVRVVAQLRNPAVGRALSGIDVAVLDVGGLSAPSVVEACLSAAGHEVVLGGEPFVAVRVTAAHSGTLREEYGALAPLAVVTPGGDPEICPGRDHRVEPGDEVTLFGTPAELDRHGLPWRHHAPAPRTPVAGRLRRLAGSLLGAADRRLAAAIGALFVLMTVSAVLLHAGYEEADGTRMSALDAVYFTVETIGTVGYGDFYFRDQADWLRAYAIVLMIVGATLATAFFALLTNILVSRRIEESLGRRRVTGLSGHVILIGLGSIGVRAVERLRAAHADVVVVDSDEHNRYLAQVRQAGIPVVIADATQPQTLAAVGLSRARAVAVLTSDDLINLETGLAVRDQLGDRWAEVPVVLRLYDRQLARTVQSAFGFGGVRSTAALAAPWFVGAALGLEVLSTFYVGDRLMLVATLTVAARGGLDGLAMRDLSARTRVVAISRAARAGELEYPPRRGTRFRAGDRAFLIGPYSDLLQVLRRDSLSVADLP